MIEKGQSMQKKNHRYERGQALILIALGFVGLVAFMGLALDAGILFTNQGHLRRAIDTAALSAANQFREGQSTTDIENSAKELLSLNMPEIDLSAGTTELHVYTCATDASLCPAAGEPPRKLVRVAANTLVELSFMPVIGIDNYRIHADAISEAASLDLVMVIDTSPSMTYDAACDDGDDDDGDGVDDDCGAGQVGATADDYLRDPDVCNPLNDCHPFEEVRAAAKKLVDDIYFPYDRVALVTFDRFADTPISLLTCSANPPYDTAAKQKLCVNNALDAMVVADIIDAHGGDPYCTEWDSHGNPAGCMPTNTTEGLRAAGNEFGNGRQEAVWITILLSDGVANAALANRPPSMGPGNTSDWFCPPDSTTPDAWVKPFCQDGDPGTRHAVGDTDYDADDAARDWAEWVGCYNDPAPACTVAGQGAVIFSIGLGNQMTDEYAASGEQLLRFIANVGWDGDPAAANDPCSGVASKLQCGNYYFAETGSELEGIFAAIASRIFTRLTH